MTNILKFIILIFITFFFVLIIFVIIFVHKKNLRNIKTQDFKGLIISKKVWENNHGSTSIVLLTEEDTIYFSPSYKENLWDISEIGDSLTKHKETYQYILIKKSGKKIIFEYDNQSAILQIILTFFSIFILPIIFLFWKLTEKPNEKQSPN